MKLRKLGDNMKRFFASILGIIVFILLVGTCTQLIAREILSAKTMNSLVEEIPSIIEEEIGIEDTEETIKEFTSVIEEEYPGISEYFNEKEFIEELVTLVATGIENLGNPDAKELIETDSFKEYINKSISKYEKETNNEVDDTLVEEIFNTMDEELYLTKESIGIGEEVIIFEIIFSNKILTTLIAGIVLCIILMFILLGKIQDTLLKVKTPFLVNGVGALIVGLGVNSFISTIEVNGSYPLDKVGLIVAAPFFKVAVVSIVIGIGLIIIAKVLKSNRSIENSNNAIENLGNETYIPNNISNTPYNGYQNH